MFRASTSSYTSEFLLRTSTPLAPLIPNACPRFSTQMASAGKTTSDTPHSYKPATHSSLLQRKPNEERDRRRRVFLKKVRQVSDDKKWESRSEQILRRDFLSKQKEWVLGQARSAPEPLQAHGNDEREAEYGSMEEVEIIDQILQQENRDFEVLVSSMQDDADQRDHYHHQQETIHDDFGSDEEEYDQLFMELLSRQGLAERSANTCGEGASEQDQEMDIALG